MSETSWSMAFSGMAEDNEENRKAFEQVFKDTLNSARKLGATMNCNGQFYGRGEGAEVNLHQDTIPMTAPNTTPVTGVKK